MNFVIIQKNKKLAKRRERNYRKKLNEVSDEIGNIELAASVTTQQLNRSLVKRYHGRLGEWNLNHCSRHHA